MKLMHVADLHLDSPFIGMSKEFQGIQKHLLKAAYIAFERCVSVAINRKVDVMLIVGDVYDAEKQTIYAQHFFAQQLERLNQADIPVLFTHGNHDYLTAQLERRKYPENVHVFMNDSVEFKDIELHSGEVARFYGFSYKTRWIKQRMIEQYPINNHETDYTIGLLHGEISSQSQIDNNYAPFTISELLEKNYNYWALGHIHMHEIHNEQPLIQYPGTIQGRHRNELGEKGAFIVEIKANEPTNSEFIPLSPIIWIQENIECHLDDQASDLTNQIQILLNNYQDESEAHDLSYIIDITLTHAERLDEELQFQIEQGELMSTLMQGQYESPFVVISKITLNRSFQISPFQYDESLNQSFKASYQSLETSESFDAVMRPLISHPVIQKYLKTMTEEDDFSKEIIMKGHDIVVQSLGFSSVEEVNSDED